MSKIPKGETVQMYKGMIQNEVDAMARKTGERPRDVSGMTLEKARAYCRDAREAMLKGRKA